MLTIVYITGNHEDDQFENKIIGKLVEVAGEHPIVSVSQKPIGLGHNICVGEVGASYRNATLQLLKGVEHASTDYVAVAESDQLYPPGYFDFKPSKSLVYMTKELYVLRWWTNNVFWRKEYGAWTVIAERLHFIARLKRQLHENFTWGSAKFDMGTETFAKRKWEVFDVGAPVITVKTRKNLTSVTGVIEGTEVANLSHWGNAETLTRYLGLR